MIFSTEAQRHTDKNFYGKNFVKKKTLDKVLTSGFDFSDNSSTYVALFSEWQHLSFGRILQLLPVLITEVIKTSNCETRLRR